MKKKKKKASKKEFKLSQVLIAGGFLLCILIASVVMVSRRRVFDEKLGMGLAVVGEEGVALLGVRPEEDSLIWVDLPTDLRLRVIDSEAWYPVESLWQLGEIEGKAEELVKQSLQQDLGVAVSGVICLENGDVSVEGVMGGLVDLGIKSSLNWWDRVLLYKTLARMMTRGLVWETSLPLIVMDVKEDEDGMKWKKLNERVWVWTKDLWPSEKILALGTTAAVYNSSDIPGRARVMGYVLESEGLRVVEVAGREEKNEGCWYETEKDSSELRWLLERQLGCRQKDGISGTDDVNAELTVWLGN